MRIVFDRHYDIGFCGLERLHPFDSHKYGRAWQVLRTRLGRRLDALWLRVPRPASREELLLVHTPEYLAKLKTTDYVAEALELRIVRRLPAWLVDRQVLRPMRWAALGTVFAARAALEHGLAVNLSGGYHHAKPDAGEGFCIYSDAALAVAMMRREARIGPDDRIVHIDLDAHQGNGISYQFLNDRRVFLYDMYNASIYPASDRTARARIDGDVPLYPGCRGDEYLQLLRSRLPAFLDSLDAPRPRLAIYNAGTDVYVGDALGQLELSAEDVLARDRFVIAQLRSRSIPVVMVPSGGYSAVSYKLLADSVVALAEDAEPSSAPKPSDDRD